MTSSATTMSVGERMVWYASAMEHLVHVVQELSLCRDLAAIREIVRGAARDLLGADGAAFVLREGDRCFYADENAIGPLWKGRRFAMSECVSGWCMLHREPVAIPDIYQDPRVPADLYRPTFVHALAMVPIRAIDPIGVIGAYWARRYQPSREQVSVLQALADLTAVAMENVRVFTTLEELVKARTADLKSTNDRLREEIALRRKAEARARARSHTDELTGLNNRRGFLTLATRRYRSDVRAGTPGWLLYADVDGLKGVNDGQGHSAGDQAILRIAQAFRAIFRTGEVVGRLGGDEFAAYGSGPAERPVRLRDRLAQAVAGLRSDGDGPALSLSIGMVRRDPARVVSFEDLLREADGAMYAEKQARRGKATKRRPRS